MLLLQKTKIDTLNNLLGLDRSKNLLRYLRMRATANGLDALEIERAFNYSSRAQSQKSFPLARRLIEFAQVSEDKANYWNTVGLNFRARNYYLEASLWYFYAYVLLTFSPEDAQKSYERCTLNYKHAYPHFEYATRQIQIPYGMSHINGYLRLPSNDQPLSGYPSVIIFNDVDSQKEELHYIENSFLRLGMATLAFDYPGQGESLQFDLMDLDLDGLGNALFLFLSQTTEIDFSRIGLFGFGLGGRFALTTSLCFPERALATAIISTPYQNLHDLSLLSQTAPRERRFIAQHREDTLHWLAAKSALASNLIHVHNATLVIGGGKDPIVPLDETRRLYEHIPASDKKLILCPNAGYGCFEMMPSLRYEIAQWLSLRLAN